MEREDGRFGLGIALLFVAAIYAVTPISPPHLMDDVDGCLLYTSHPAPSGRPFRFLRAQHGRRHRI